VSVEEELWREGGGADRARERPCDLERVVEVDGALAGFSFRPTTYKVSY
jgi:hypothetical protein